MTKKVKEQKEESCYYCREDKDRLIKAGKICCPNCKRGLVSTHQKNPVESLIEEFSKFCDDNGFNPSRSECTDWWLEKLSSQHDQLLAEMLESVGEVPTDIIFYTGLIRGKLEERDRIRSLLLAKQRKQ